jgi:predicted Zn-dependent protease
MSRRIRVRLAVAAASIVAAVLVSCAVNPVTGKKQLSLMSESQEIALGAESDPQIVAEFGLYDDPNVQAYVNTVGQKMARLSHRPNLKWTFRVLDSPVLNAFALPGGYCYITRGILAHMNNEAELAMVVGHEIGHVTARHGAEQYTRQQIAGIGLGVGSILSQQVAQYAGAAQQALGLMFLKYGRDDETQSDELGVEYALKAGYDAEAGAKFFEVLDRQNKESGGGALPEWLSTHPAAAGRVTRTRALAQQRKPEFATATRVGEAEHKNVIDGIVFGDDPRQGFMDGNAFKHPALKFHLDLPAGWQVQNTPTALLSAAPQQTAVLQLTLEDAQGATPQQYAAKLAQSAGAQIAQGGAESIHGAEGYIAVLQVADPQGNVTAVQAGFIRRTAGGPIYRILGMTSPSQFQSYRADFLRTIRSLRPLTDAAALAVKPNRVAIESVKSAATLEQAVQRGGAPPVPVATVAFINNLQPSSNLPAGFRLKSVRGSFRQ